MITAIGLMIGIYILNRYIEMGSRTKSNSAILIMGLSGVITLLCIVVILLKDIADPF